MMSSLSPHRRLYVRLVLVALFDAIGPFYALFTLWFADHGLGATQISSVFILWALVSMVCEVPSGALADRVDRRHVMAGALVLRAAGMAVMLWWPTWTGALIGASLWAMHTASSSGTWEALVYDQLQSELHAHEYTVVMARLGQSNHMGTVIGSLTATALLGLAHMTLDVLGWITIALHAISLWAVLTLPDVTPADEEDDEPDMNTYSAWWSTLVQGARAALVPGTLRRVLMICMVLEGAFILDEYMPLLARTRGASDAMVPWFVLSTWGGLIVGGEIAARRPHLSGRALGVLMSVGVIAFVGVWCFSSIWALLGIGVCYGTMNIAWVLSEARLQDHAPQAQRATVHSVASFVAGIINIALFAWVGALALDEDLTLGLSSMTGVLLLIVVGLVVWLPDAKEELR